MDFSIGNAKEGQIAVTGKHRWWFRFGMGLVLSTSCLVWVLRDVQWNKVGAELTGANYWLVALSVVTAILVAATKAARWRALFYPDRRLLHYSSFLSTLLIAQSLNILIPARLGELARLYLMDYHENRPAPATLSTIVVEKVADLFFVSALAVVVLPSVAMPFWLRGSTEVVLAAATAASLGLLLAGRWRERAGQLLERSLTWVPSGWRVRLLRIANLALAALAGLADWRAGVLIVGWSLLVWLLSLTTIYLLFLAFALKLPIVAAASLFVALQFGAGVPSSPGLVGVVHFVAVAVLSLFDVDYDLALSYGFILHLVMVGPVVVLGLFFSWRQAIESAAWVAWVKEHLHRSIA